MTIVVALGMLMGLGVVMVLAQLRPAPLDLDAALERLYSAPTPTKRAAANERITMEERVGTWLEHRPNLVSSITLPTKELRLLQRSKASFIGEKLLLFSIGLFIPLVIAVLVTVLNLPLPWTIPAMAAPVLALAMSYIPNLNIKAEAQKAKDEYNRALGTYIELTALQRKSGIGAEESLRSAANGGNTPFFRRIQEKLTVARIQHIPAWDALEELSDELEVPALSDVADLMRMSGEEGVGVYDALRERSSSLRNQILNADMEAAADESQRMIIPGIIMLAVLACLFFVPRIMSLFGS